MNLIKHILVEIITLKLSCWKTLVMLNFKNTFSYDKPFYLKKEMNYLSKKLLKDCINKHSVNYLLRC